MKILKITLYVLLGIVALFLIVAAFLPSKYKVERSVDITAGFVPIYESIIKLENWSAWDPWMSLDPDAENIYTGAERGIGQKHEWNGKIVGSGNMSITDAVENETMNFDLEFTEPFYMKATGGFILNPKESGITVSWFMEGNLKYPIERFMGLTMDKQLGGDFEKGLAKLKEISEKKEKETPSETEEIKETVGEVK